MSEAPTLAEGETTFGKYELLDRLGRGGMADVWRARVAGPQGFARTLVLKRILPHLIRDAKARQLFEREARVVSRLSHAGIVQVYEFGEVDGEYYLAMEYVEGRDVSAIIRAGGASPAIAALVCRDVCRALGYAHALRDDDGEPLRILHRDVSPSNVIVGRDGSVKLLDFGIAKAFGDPRDKRSVQGTLRGKFGYIAPEVIEGLAPDGRADLFSVGVLLHETLVGTRLFRGASDLETLVLVRRSVIPRPSALNPRVPAALDEICMRALTRNRDERYPSGEAMADALDEVVHELRFGPTQAAELIERLFPRGGAMQVRAHEDSGPRTVEDMPVPEVAELERAAAEQEARSRTSAERPTVDPLDERITEVRAVVAPVDNRRTEARPTVLPPSVRPRGRYYALVLLLLVALAGIAVWRGRSATRAGSQPEVAEPAPAGPAVYQ